MQTSIAHWQTAVPTLAAANLDLTDTDGAEMGALVQVGKHGEHAPVLGLGRIELELVEDARHVFLHGRLADDECLGDAVVGFALGHRGQHVALARAESVQRAVALAAAEHPPDDLGIQRATAPGDPGDSIDEAVEITDALFKQVANSLSAVPDQVERVALLVVLGKHQHAGVWPPAAQLDRGSQPIVAVSRWHVDIGDHDGGTVSEALAQQIGGLAGLGDDIEPGLGEQSRDPLPQEDVVLTDYHSQGF
jgi:hypothetical protein